MKVLLGIWEPKDAHPQKLTWIFTPKIAIFEAGDYILKTIILGIYVRFRGGNVIFVVRSQHPGWGTSGTWPFRCPHHLARRMAETNSTQGGGGVDVGEVEERVQQKRKGAFLESFPRKKIMQDGPLIVMNGVRTCINGLK